METIPYLATVLSTSCWRLQLNPRCCSAIEALPTNRQRALGHFFVASGKDYSALRPGSG